MPSTSSLPKRTTCVSITPCSRGSRSKETSRRCSPEATSSSTKDSGWGKRGGGNSSRETHLRERGGRRLHMIWGRLRAARHGWLLLLFSLNLPAQPNENGKNFRPAELIELIKTDTTLRLDIRYATSNNFMHRPMYTQARAFLQRPAAEAL